MEMHPNPQQAAKHEQGCGPPPNRCNTRTNVHSPVHREVRRGARWQLMPVDQRQHSGAAAKRGEHVACEHRRQADEHRVASPQARGGASRQRALAPPLRHGPTKLGEAQHPHRQKRWGRQEQNEPQRRCGQQLLVDGHAAHHACEHERHTRSGGARSSQHRIQLAAVGAGAGVRVRGERLPSVWLVLLKPHPRVQQPVKDEAGQRTHVAASHSCVSTERRHPHAGSRQRTHCVLQLVHACTG